MAGKGAGKIAGPSVHRIPCGVLAHLGDQKSGCLVEEEWAPGSIGPPTDLDSEVLR